MGNRAEAIYDVGVAGLHRLLEHREKLAEARVIICVAGMEGALPSVVGGTGGGAGDCGADEHGLRSEFRRADGAAGDAEQLRVECQRGEYR